MKKELIINREDMLALTRRMTVTRTSMRRIAGMYVDQEGEMDGTFNIRFLKLSPAERERNLALAKQIPFAGTNTQLRRYFLPDSAKQKDSVWKLLAGIRDAELENDALLDLFYECFMEGEYRGSSYGIFFFHDIYDIPAKASDHERLGESEQTYSYLICAVCPVTGEYEAGDPVWGFLYPAYVEGGAAVNCVDVYEKERRGEISALTDWLLDR